MEIIILVIFCNLIFLAICCEVLACEWSKISVSWKELQIEADKLKIMAEEFQRNMK